jgi:hypothetical protein
MFTHAGASPAYLRLFDPAAKSLRTLFHAPQMRAHDMTLSWDAQTIFIGGGGVVAEVGVDGAGYRVISTGQSPAELPDGRVIFFDEAPGISPCKATGVRQLLFAVNRDGSRRRVVSANLTIDTTPQIMSDGRVLFCRWDYRIYCWIDANVPFYGHYEQLSPTILSEPARQELQELYQRRCAACHDQRPRQDAITWLSPFSIWVHTGPQPGQWGISESGLRVRHLNLTQPEHSLALQAPLAAAAGGLQMCVQQDRRPVFGDRNDPDYQRALRALREGVVRRDQPGVRELLSQTKSQAE